MNYFTTKVKLKTLGKKKIPGSHFNYKLFEAPAAPTSQMFHTPVPLFILNILPQMPFFSPPRTTLSPSCRPYLYSFPLWTSYTPLIHFHQGAYICVCLWASHAHSGILNLKVSTQSIIYIISGTVCVCVCVFKELTTCLLK